jgi:hypothetical protein
VVVAEARLLKSASVSGMSHYLPVLQCWPLEYDSSLHLILPSFPGKLDAYATVYVLDGFGGDLRRGKSTTRVIRQTTEPVWNEELAVPLVLAKDEYAFSSKQCSSPYPQKREKRRIMSHTCVSGVPNVSL